MAADIEKLQFIVGESIDKSLNEASKGTLASGPEIDVRSSTASELINYLEENPATLRTAEVLLRLEEEDAIPTCFVLDVFARCDDGAIFLGVNRATDMVVLSYPDGRDFWSASFRSIYDCSSRDFSGEEAKKLSELYQVAISSAQSEGNNTLDAAVRESGKPNRIAAWSAMSDESRDSVLLSLMSEMLSVKTNEKGTFCDNFRILFENIDTSTFEQLDRNLYSSGVIDLLNFSYGHYMSALAFEVYTSTIHDLSE